MSRDTTSMPRLESGLADVEAVRDACLSVRSQFQRLQQEIGRAVVGQRRVVDETLVALFAGGHVLLEGVPGLGKTLLVRTLSETLSLSFARIQFTPDLMPADITGTNVLAVDAASGHRAMVFRAGPIFAQLLLADEINRATPKSQSALLEAMQEGTVSSGGETRSLPDPFFVMATQNPIEQEGTYPLPEAQLDRFMLKINVPQPTREEVNTILDRTTGADAPRPKTALDATFILQAQRLVRQLVVAPHVRDYVVRIIQSTHPRRNGGSGVGPPEIERWIEVGASPRGGQALIGAAKVVALMGGRYSVSMNDVRKVAHACMRHRIITSWEARAEQVDSDAIITAILDHLPAVEVES